MQREPYDEQQMGECIICNPCHAENYWGLQWTSPYAASRFLHFHADAKESYNAKGKEEAVKPQVAEKCVETPLYATPYGSSRLPMRCHLQ